MKKNDSIEKLESRLATYEKNAIVKVRISYLIKVMEMLGNELYDGYHEKLCNLLLKRINNIELLKKLGRDYIEMTIKDVEYLLATTNKLNIDKSMLVVFDYHSKTKRK